MNKIFDKLLEARKSYPDSPIMTDQEYDELLDSYINSDDCTDEQLLLLTMPHETDSIMVDVTESDFSIPAIKTEEELNNFLLSNGTEQMYKVSIKVDGIRGNAIYSLDTTQEQPYVYKREKVVSRGTRRELHNLVASKFPPYLKLNGSTVPTFTMAAECYCKESDLLEINFRKRYEYTNTLAAANSLAKTGVDGNDELLNVNVHRVLHPLLLTRELEMQIAEALNITTVPYKVVEGKDVYDTVMLMRNEAVDKGIPTDGIVVERNDKLDSSFSLTGGKAAYDDMIAYKPSEWVTNTYTSKVTNIYFENTGYQLNAKIQIKPVMSREGKTFTEVSGFNPGYIINKLGLTVGDYIEFTYNSNNNVKIERRLTDEEAKLLDQS